MHTLNRVLSIFLIFFCLFISNMNMHAQDIVFVHTNKNDYISGETMQFAVYVVNQENSGLSNSSKVAYFQLTGSNQIVISGLRANVENSVCSGEITLPDSLKSGYYLLSAYTNALRNYPENTYFNKKILIINQNDEKLDSILDFSLTENLGNQNLNNKLNENKGLDCKIITDKDQYKPREKVSLKIQFDNLLKNSEISNLSVSVTKQSPFEDTSYTNNFVSYFHEKNLEWEHLNHKKNTNSNHSLIEKNAYIIRGQLVNKTNFEPLKNYFVLLATPDSIANLQYYRTDIDGAFYFQLNKFYDNKTIYLVLNNSFSTDNNYLFKIEDKKINPIISTISNLDLSAYEKNYFEISRKLFIVNKVFSLYKKSENSDKKSNNDENRLPFFGKADDVILPADYLDLPDFKEMVQNYLWGIKLKQTNNKFKLNIINSEEKTIQNKDGFLLINSIPVFDLDELLPLNSSTIKRIELKKKNIAYGNFPLFGILSIQTSDKIASAIFNKLQLQKFQNNVIENSKFIGLSREQILEPQNKSVPYLMQNLYWNPHLTTAKNNESDIEFYTSDLKTKYIIKVQGITKDNKPIFAENVFEVK